MKKLVIFIIIILITSLAACQAAAAPPVEGTPEIQADQPLETVASAVPVQGTPTGQEQAFPVTVIDDEGREVTLVAAPRRIISLAPSNTELLFAVGAGDAVVGVTEFCNYPIEAAGLPKVGGFTANTISMEVLLSLKPDLVLAYSIDHQILVEALERENIPTLVLAPETYEDIYTNILQVGQATGNRDQAEQLVEDMKARTDAVIGKVASVPLDERPAVFWELWDEPLMTAGPASFIGQVIERAGGTNIFSDLEGTYPEVSAEEIVKRDPQVILGPDSHGDKLLPELLAARPGWEQLDAVKNKRIYLLDADISSRGGPRIIDALELTARALYPELFK